ncbi:MAG TPA: discoidin domain-containing protein, partial [Rhodopila sp.]|nr:discoidin domain-containing protein [Rhodopila sp.]
MFFHTDLEDSPDVTVDLKVARPIRRIRIFNEEGAPGRAVPMIILSSLDGENWHQVCSIDFVFGGRRSGTPFQLNFREALHCRFLKLQVQRSTFLHLDYIEICVFLPDPQVGRYRNVTQHEDKIIAEYWHHDSHGF